MEMDDKFKELTSFEEKGTERKKLEIYYNELAEYYASLPFDESGMKIREKIHPLLLKLMKLAHNLNVKIVNNDLDTIPPTAIYAVNHTNICDIPTACRVVKKHAFVLVENGVEHRDFNGFVLKLNGAIFIDRKDKIDRNRAKIDMIKTLLHGKNVIMFPEGTWNMSPNKIMLPFNWGIIEIAKKAQVPIIPIVLEYYENDILVSIGKKMEVSIYDDKSEAINELRDRMSTLRWNILETLPILKRKELESDYFEKVLNFYLEEYPKLNVEYEKSVILKPYPEEEEVYSFMKKMQPSLNNAFLYKKLNVCEKVR